MKKPILFIELAFILVIGLSACSNEETISNFSFKTETKLYQPVIVEFDAKIPGQDMADAKQIQVDMEIIAPNADTLHLPCFYLQNNDTPNKWQARFTPQQVGQYSFKIKTTSNQNSSYSSQQSFSCIKPTDSESNTGLLTIDKKDNFYLKYDNGEKFKGLGLNVGWVFEPKWNNPDIYTFEMFFKEMQKYGANFIRMWICPWNMPIEWTPVPNYEMIFDDFTDLSKVYDHSKGLEISPGTTKECQSDEGQLIKSSSSDEYIIYKVDAPKLFKLMIYNKGDIALEDFELAVSSDNETYTHIETTFSQSWNSFEEWQRIFLYSYNLGDENIKYVKLTLKSTLNKQNIKLAGIQLRHGDPISVLDCNGLNHYSKNNSDKLDNLLKLADKYDIKILITLGYHGQFNAIMDSWGANDEWQRNPYNVKNGGPCATPADFFTNKEAKEAYKNYLRYFVARWGYSNVVAGWELWNEIDITQRNENVAGDDMVAWHAEMSGFLKEIDPYNHIVTTSYSHGQSDALWSIESLDISHTHHYSPTNFFNQLSNEMLHKYNKPHMIGEYAVDWKGPGFGYTAEDYEEEFHDGMWRGLFTESPILPLSWWWEYHLDNGHYKYFKPLRIAIEKLKANDNIALLELEQPVGYQIFGLDAENTKLVWIKNIDKTKYKNSVPVKLDGVDQCSVSILNTYTGEISKSTSFNNGRLLIRTKEFSSNRDVLLILEK